MSNQAVNSSPTVKAATDGFLTLLSSPASPLTPQQALEAGHEFAKRASKIQSTHEDYKEVIRKFIREQ